MTPNLRKPKTSTTPWPGADAISPIRPRQKSGHRAFPSRGQLAIFYSVGFPRVGKMVRSSSVLAVMGVLLFGNCSSGTDAPPLGDLGEMGSDRPLSTCLGHADCDDKDPCTHDSCLNGECRYNPVSCDDSDPCTDDWCGPVGCSHTRKPRCCLVEADCDDKDPCTRDRCVSHACVHDVLDPTCCSKDEQCDDENDCTWDRCDKGKCVHQMVTGGPKGCCQDASQCLDGNPCTDDLCIDNRCVYKNAGCCTTDEECDDLNPCTTGTCNAKQKCDYLWKKGCCVTSEDCDDDNACTSEVCKSQKCEVTTLSSCCKDDSDCQVSDPCKKGTCKTMPGQEKGECVISLISTPECCTSTLVSANFDDGTLQGFTAEALYPVSGPSWVVDSRRAASPPFSLYFGDPLTHTYDAGLGQPVGGIATSPEADLAKTWEPEVRFSLWKKTEAVASSDVLSVRVVFGGQEREVWSTAAFPMFSDTGGDFLTVRVSLGAFADHKVRIRFVFDTITGFANAYEGVYIDDIEVTGRCL